MPSPTGTPFIPPQYVPLLLMALTVLNGALVAIQQNVANPTAKLVCTILLATIAPVLAALSPGLRRNDGGAALLTKKLGSTGAISVLALVVGLVVLAPAPAQAGEKLDWAAGPTIPLIRYDIASPVPVQVAAGAGLQLSLTLDSLKRDFLGRSWDLVSFDVMGFGSIVNGNGSQFGALSAAGGVCIFSSLACINYGHDILTADQHLRGGPGFLLLAFSFNVALAPTVPASFDRAEWHLPRANTLYLFGGP